MEQQPASAVSRRAREITPFLVMDILERPRSWSAPASRSSTWRSGSRTTTRPSGQGRGLPGHGRGETQYTHSQGLMELRQVLCRHYWDKYRVSVTPEQFIVTSGTSRP